MIKLTKETVMDIIRCLDGYSVMKRRFNKPEGLSEKMSKMLKEKVKEAQKCQD